MHQVGTPKGDWQLMTQYSWLPITRRRSPEIKTPACFFPYRDTLWYVYCWTTCLPEPYKCFTTHSAHWNSSATGSGAFLANQTSCPWGSCFGQWSSLAIRRVEERMAGLWMEFIDASQDGSWLLCKELSSHSPLVNHLCKTIWRSKYCYQALGSSKNLWLRISIDSP